MKTCPACREINGNNQDKCFRCGAPLPSNAEHTAQHPATEAEHTRVCPKCKKTYLENTRECPQCHVPVKIYAADAVNANTWSLAAGTTTRTDKNALNQNAIAISIFTAVAIILAVIGVIAGFAVLFLGLGIFMALTIWGSFAGSVLLFYAIVCLLKNQATIIDLLNK